MKRSAQHLIAKVPRRQTKLEMTIGIDLGDIWSHYCTLNEEGMVARPRPVQSEPEGRCISTGKCLAPQFAVTWPRSRLC
jgi:hypothetical protein